ncbi:MAG: lysylphosphatidylglycerol synthase transmembrane domain-containing protein, partial [Saprospiraceae bacterium]|nr:lysylphosphatidylglycerol synthase transmembrane domain-containing protein [Saprospiraceae bacterium]
MVEPEVYHELTDEEKKIVDRIRPSRIFLPMFFGLLAIAYLLWRQFDPEAFAKVNWTYHTLAWVGVAVGLQVIRHLSYAARLKLLSDGEFSWLKSIELIFIWEFSSAVSPTSLGGSIVAFFMLAQEKLSTARTATIVIYTIIMDTLFFIIVIPLLYIIYGAQVIRPDITSFGDSGGWGGTLVAFLVAMILYGGFFSYGMFVNPKGLKYLLKVITSIKWLKRWRESAMELGDEIILASRDIKGRSMFFHLGGFLTTASAWSCRFLVINAFIIAFVPSTALDIVNQGLLYGRSGYMFLIMAFSPTPGSSGLAEMVFGGFLSDFVPIGFALLLAFMWRLLTYYFYLFAGVIVIPNWIRKVLNRR